MKESEKNLERTLAEAELGNFLRQMANALEGQVTEGYDELKAGLSGYAKFELKIRRTKEKVLVKLKVKPALISKEPSDKGAIETAEDAKPKYKTLKKKMKPAFKAIAASISKDEFPDALSVKSFIADSEAMMDYPGNGNEYYAAFREALVNFAEAFENRNLVLIKESCSTLNQLKDECHKRYK